MKLLIAYDGHEHSRFALNEGARIAAEEGAEVTVLGVVHLDVRGINSAGQVGFAPYTAADIAHARRYLGEHGVAAETKIVSGDPADEILEEAKRGGYDLIVVGTRELGPVTGRLLRSVSQKVAKHAPCPIVVAGAHGSKRLEPVLASTA